MGSSTFGSPTFSSSSAAAISLLARVVVADLDVVVFSFFSFADDAFLTCCFASDSFTGAGSGAGASKGVTLILRRGAAASVEVVGVVVVVRVDRDALVAGCATATTISSSSLLSLTSSTTGVNRADLVAFVSGFLVTRDFDSMAFVLLVVGTAFEGAVFRFGASSRAVLVSGSAARARVTRRGFAGLAGFRGAILIRVVVQCILEEEIPSVVVVSLLVTTPVVRDGHLNGR
jgi:hypothetical protein